jgi:predicted ATP-grasp superfamily ATP-dependent carboligase
VPVYGVHADRRSPAARSRFWSRNAFWNLDGARPEDSVAWLLNLAEQVGETPILLPTDDESCLFVADHAPALRQRYRFPDQPDGLARELVSKRTMYELCKKHGVPTAETLFPQSRQDVLEYGREGTFPVMLKGVDTKALRRRTGVSMVVVENASDLLRRYDELESPDAPALMLQEYIPGGPEQVWMFNGYFDAQSRCLFGLTGKKLRQYPAYTGVTSLGICLGNETVATQTRDFMRALGYRGILDIGYKYDVRTGEYKLLDVNPRIGSSFRLFVDSAGLDVARALYLDLTGQAVTGGVPREGRRWIVENFDLLSSLTYWRDGRLTLLNWARSFRGIEEASWLALDDPVPLLAMLGRSVAVAAAGSMARGTRGDPAVRAA